jgi:hypothetical protein
MFKTRSSKKLVGQRSRVLRERANLSFFIVVMFFAVFGVIVLTEIFLIDERGRGTGMLVRHGGRRRGDKPDYEDDGQPVLQASVCTARAQEHGTAQCRINITDALSRT